MQAAHRAARLFASRRAAAGNKAAQQLAHMRALLAHAGRLRAHRHSLDATIALRCIGADPDALVNRLTACCAPWSACTLSAQEFDDSCWATCCIFSTLRAHLQGGVRGELVGGHGIHGVRRRRAWVRLQPQATQYRPSHVCWPRRGNTGGTSAGTAPHASSASHMGALHGARQVKAQGTGAHRTAEQGRTKHGDCMISRHECSEQGRTFSTTRVPESLPRFTRLHREHILACHTHSRQAIQNALKFLAGTALRWLRTKRVAVG